MVVQEKQSIRRAATIATFLSLAIGGIVQYTALTIWGANIDFRISNSERDHLEMHKLVASLDERGSRNFPLIEQRLRQIEALQPRIDAMLVAQPVNAKEMEFIRQEMARIVEQQRRIIESLDNTYNKLQENINKTNEIDATSKILLQYFRSMIPNPPR